MEQILKGRISVDGLKLLARKGLYASEAKLENEFLLSAWVEYRVGDLQNGTYLDYTLLARIMKDNFMKDDQLLETIAQNILRAIQKEWPIAIAAHVKISKQQPHLRDDLNAVCVEISF